MRLGAERFSKVEFLSHLCQIRKQTFKATTILSAWRKTGLWPYNPSVVINQLRQHQGALRTPSPPPPPQSVTQLTPRRLYELHASGKRIQSEIDGQVKDSPFKKRLISWMKGAIAISLENESARQERDQYLAAEKTRKSRSKSQKHVFKGGSITVANARFKSKERKAAEATKAIRWLRRKTIQQEKRALQQEEEKIAIQDSVTQEEATEEARRQHDAWVNASDSDGDSDGDSDSE